MDSNPTNLQQQLTTQASVVLKLSKQGEKFKKKAQKDFALMETGLLSPEEAHKKMMASLARSLSWATLFDQEKDKLNVLHLQVHGTTCGCCLK